MDQLVVVAYPHPLTLSVERFEQESVPDEGIGLAYYFRGSVIARSIATPDALDSIESLLDDPVMVALAAQEDDGGNIEGRVCLVLPMRPDGDATSGKDPDADAPWKDSIPAPPSEIGENYATETGGDGAQMALLPIGNIIRSASGRNHDDDVSADVREMLENLLSGGGQDAVAKAIDDLLDSI